MADHEPLAADSLQGGGSGTFAQLLFSSSNDNVLGLDSDGCFNYASSVSTPQKMLCFADYHQINNNESDLSNFAQKSGLTCSDSSSTSSTNNNPLLSKSKKKRNGRASEPVAGAGAPAGSQGNGKKTRSLKPAAVGHAKGKKESIGERIAALQQLVSPFGKTDTASVLHEAQGYIRFLQDQVQVLCSPYMQPLSGSSNLDHEGEKGGEDKAKDLRSKGLCLVPVESTLHVANTNGADFWLPAMKTNASSSDH